MSYKELEFALKISFSCTKLYLKGGYHTTPPIEMNTLQNFKL